jgi:glycosyltransferase involved in cell wall biosynthesis
MTPRILMVTNFATHYRARLFELLHQRLNVEFLFFSEGGEEYWQPHLGVSTGLFPGDTVAGGPSLGKLRLNLGLLRQLQSRDFDVVVKCMNGRLELPMTYAVARRRGAAFVLWTGMWMHPHSIFHTVSRPFAQWTYKHSDSIVTYGDHVSQFVVEEGAEPSAVFAAENAVDNAFYSRQVDAVEIAAVRARLQAGNERIILAVSRLVPQKGLEVLVDAVAGLAEPLRVVVVGTGPLARALQDRAGWLGVRLSLLGGLQPPDLPALYAAADVFVMPSITTAIFKETWGLACNEAMCQGTPVVTTTAVGAAAGGLLKDGATGLVVPEQDPAALRAALHRLLDDTEFAKRLGENGRARVARTNHLGMVDGFERAIKHALTRRGARS